MRKYTIAMFLKIWVTSHRFTIKTPHHLSEEYGGDQTIWEPLVEAIPEGWCCRYTILPYSIGYFTESEFNVNIIEDPYHEEDFNSFATLKSKHDGYAKIIGDDLVCSNYNLLKKALKNKSIDGIIVKINQCGTISETLNTISLAKKNKIKTILSARSGDTEEVFLSHFAVAWNLDMIKIGSFSRSERTSKWNELIRIDEELKKFKI